MREGRVEETKGRGNFFKLWWTVTGNEGRDSRVVQVSRCEEVTRGESRRESSRSKERQRSVKCREV